MKRPGAERQRGGLGGGEGPANLAPPSLTVCGGWSGRGAPSELAHLGGDTIVLSSQESSSVNT